MEIKGRDLNKFFVDWTYNSKYKFLEFSNEDDKAELIEVAEKKGIKLPSIDLAIFKCEFFYVDVFNNNGCKLERSEVEETIGTIIGKQIDINHKRKRICGHWIDYKLEGNTVITYGAFFKQSLAEDYEIVKELMENGELFVSMEAWGKRDYNPDKSYSLRDVEMAGGALLLPEEEGGSAPPPAYPGAAVLNLAKKYSNNKRVMEFASDLKAPKEFFHTKGEEKMAKENVRGTENANFSSYEMDAVVRLMWEVECPGCKDKGPNILMVDFENNKVKAKCFNCDEVLSVNLTPQSKVLKKGRKVKDVAMVEKEEEKIEDKKADLDKSKEVNKPIEEDSSKINKEETSMDKLLKQFSKSTIEEVIQEVAEATIERELTKDELDKSKVSVGEKGKDVTEDNVKDIVKAFVAVVKKEGAGDEGKDGDDDKCEKCANKEKEIARLQSGLENAEKKVDDYKEAEKVAKIAADAKTLKERKAVLGETATDMSSEDLLNDDKFEIAKLKKENAKLKKDGGIESANEDDDEVEDGPLEMGAEKEEDEEDEDGRVKEKAGKKVKTISDIAFSEPVERDCDDGKIG